MGVVTSSAGLLFRIDGDASQLKRELQSVDASFSSLGSKFESVGGIAAVATASFAAIGASLAVVGAAAVNTTNELLSLAKSASEYGSKIHDISQQTGLGAEAISSLIIAADQSSTSIESVTTGLGRFAKTVGAAGDGSKEAAAKLISLGVDPQAALKDLDGQLGKVFQRIADAKPGIEQTTLAQKAFGKSGADLIPMILSFDGNMPSLIAHMKDLGLTMSDNDAAAADAFGDQMDTLQAQLTAVGRVIGFEVMPVFMDMATSMSSWVAAHQVEIHNFGENVGNALRGVIGYWQDATSAVQQYVNVVSFLKGLSDQSFGGQLVNSLISRGQQGNGVVYSTGEPGTYEAAPRPRSWGSSDINVPQKAGKSPKDDTEQRAREAEQRRREAVQAALREMHDTLEIYRAGYDERRAALELLLAQGKRSEEQYATEIHQIQYESLLDEQQQIKEKLLDNSKIQMNDEERATALQRLKIIEIDLRIEQSKRSKDILSAQNKEKENLEELKKKEQALHDERRKHWKEYIDALQKQDDLEQAALERKTREYNDAQNASANKKEGVLGRSVLTDISTNIDGLEVRTTNLSNAFQALQEIGGGALQSLAQGMGNLVQQWVLYGTAGPNAMRKLVASILAGVAAQAAVLAIMELAYGVAALTPWGAAIYGPAVNHFKAAALFGSVAAIAAVAGRGIAGSAFQNQTANGGAGASGGGGGSQSQNNNFTEGFHGFGGQSTLAKMLNRHIEMSLQVNGQLADTLHRFSDKFMTASPHEVVMAGAAGASRELHKAVVSEANDSGSRATGDWVRANGFAR